MESENLSKYNPKPRNHKIKKDYESDNFKKHSAYEKNTSKIKAKEKLEEKFSAHVMNKIPIVLINKRVSLKMY